MNTITIPDPAEVLALVQREFPECLSYTVGYSSDHMWMATVYPAGEPILTAFGSGPDELVGDIREKLTPPDGLAELRAEAAKHGMKLVLDRPF